MSTPATTDLLVTDWFKVNYFAQDWTVPKKVGVKLYSRAPAFTTAQEASFASVTSLDSLQARPAWAESRNTVVESVALNLKDVGSGRIQLGTGSFTTSLIEGGAGWNITGTSDLVVAAVIYYQGTLAGVVNPVLFASTKGIGDMTVVHSGSVYGQTAIGVTGAPAMIVNVGTSAGSLTVTFRARSASNVATLTTSTPHSLVVSDVVTIAGVGGTGYNGSYTVTAVPTNTTFTYANTGSSEATIASGGGTVVRRSANFSSGSSLLSLVPAFWESSHAQHVWIEPQRTNMIANPSFELAGGGYWGTARVSGTASVTRVSGGVGGAKRPYCGAVAGTGGTGDLVLESNLFPKVGPWVSVAFSLSGVAGEVRYGIVVLDESYTRSTFFRSKYVPVDGGSATGGYQRFEALIKIPDDVVDMRFRIEYTGTNFWVDNVLVDPHEGQYTYFDGDSVDGMPGDFIWHGGSAYANKQFSLWYNNYVNTKSRLIGSLDADENVYKAGLLEDWAPTGASILAHWEAVTPITPQNWQGDAFYPVTDVATSGITTVVDSYLFDGAPAFGSVFYMPTDDGSHIVTGTGDDIVFVT